MLIIPEPKSKQRRIRVTTPNSAAPPLTALVVTAVDEVEFKDGTGTISLTLDVHDGYALVDPLVADAAQWNARYGGLTWVGTSVLRHGDDGLTILFESVEYDPAPDTLSYAADPSDIADTQGRMLGGFSGMAI